MGIAIPNFGLRTLADLGAFTPQQAVQGMQQTFMPQTLADIAKFAQQRDYQGAASAAFTGGAPDIAEKLLGAADDQRQRQAQIAASLAMRADTPTAWSNASKAYGTMFPGQALPDFSQRDALIAAGTSPSDLFSQGIQEKELGLKQAEYGLDRSKLMLDAAGNPFLPDAVRKQLGLPSLGGPDLGNSSPGPGGPSAPGATTAAPQSPSAETDPDAYADAVIQRMGLPPQIAGLIKGIGTYTLDPTKIASIRGNQREQLIAAVSAAYPGFDMTNYAIRQATRKAFTTGPQGQTITANRTAIHHLGQLWDDVNALGNGSWTPINAIRNEAKTLTGNPAVTNVNTDMQAVATEVAKALRGAGAMSEGEISDWQKNFSPNASPAQMQQAIQRAVKLLGARNEMLSQAYQSGMGKQMPTFLSDEDVGVLNKMGVSPGDFDPNYVKDSNGGVTAGAGGPQPGDVEDGYRFKGGDPSVQSNWEPAR